MCRAAECTSTCSDGRVELDVTDDVFVDSGSPTTRWNGDHLVFGDSGGTYQNILLKFQDPFSHGLPRSGVHVTRVELCVQIVRAHGIVPGSSIDIYAYENRGCSWSEETATWSGHGCSSSSILGSMTYNESNSYRCMTLSGVDLNDVDAEGITLAQRTASGRRAIFYDHENSPSQAPSMNVHYECD